MKLRVVAPSPIAALVLALSQFGPKLDVAISGLFNHAPTEVAAMRLDADPTAQNLAPIAPLEMPRGDGLVRTVLAAEDGDTLPSLLRQADIPGDEAARASEALRRLYDMKRLRYGQAVTVLYDAGDTQTRQAVFKGFEIRPDAERVVAVMRRADGTFEASQVKRPLRATMMAARGVIRTTLFEAAARAQVPNSVMLGLIKAFSYDIDFQRDLQPGDRFEVMYDAVATDQGIPTRIGDIAYAALTLSGERYELFGFRRRDGQIEYFDRDGHSVRKALLRTPVDGAEVTSGFGMRLHPILGYSRMHKGVDFGAPVGTPVYAAGDGVVEQAGWWGSYGRYIRLKHDQKMDTAYAHLSRIAPDVQPGRPVHQGQIIGYVGTTGNSTGPHLHYEVLRDGEQVNPNAATIPHGTVLDGRDLVAFKAQAAQTEREFAAIAPGSQFAARVIDIATVQSRN